MIKRIAKVVAVFGAASIISGCITEQPSAGCIVQDSSFALWQAKYMVKEADAAKTCGNLKGEELGVWKYANPEATAEQIAANRASRLAIRPRGTASLTRYTYKYTDAAGKEQTKTVDRVSREEWDDATALSTTLPQSTDAEGFCKATGFAAATVNAAAVFDHVDTSMERAAATSVSYQFGDVEVYSHPSAPGTQLRGTMTYTQDGCTAEYEVWALWPATPCVPGSEDPVESCGAGSGLNPDFAAVCEPTLKRCVPAKRPPSFNVSL